MKKGLLTQWNHPFSLLSLAILSTLWLAMEAQAKPVGLFENHQDVGNPAIKGGATYDRESQIYRLKGAGKNMWEGEDQFHFAWNKIEGDFIVTASIQFVGVGARLHRKIGIMARETLETGSRYADACVHGDTLSSLQYRSKEGGVTDQVVVSSFHPTDIALERKGNTFTFSARVFGEDNRSVSYDLDLKADLFVGLFICSHDEAVVEEALFSNVRIVIPAPDDLVQYRDYLGSRLETMDVFTGHRTILHSENRSIQAPNWTTDGQSLIYNAEGLLYKYNLKSGSIRTLNTGLVRDNNNDHVLSFDGKQLGISSKFEDPAVSTIYTLPAEGSDHPTPITDPQKGHSYLHGWSPDAKRLVFTGHRDDQWDIWAIDISSRREFNLTQNETLDDGPEYSPDGKWIYFNSVRTGTMQIWRMKPDGAQQEQITFDAHNNWFPHFSPNGKWIVYIAFPGEMDPSAHPFYKRVYLKLMPASGGVPKTIASLYGGQGTINVPSWSPDSRTIAFVSNSGM